VGAYALCDLKDARLHVRKADLEVGDGDRRVTRKRLYRADLHVGIAVHELGARRSERVCKVGIEDPKPFSLEWNDRGQPAVPGMKRTIAGPSGSAGSRPARGACRHC
jgi:hypothetical protein